VVEVRCTHCGVLLGVRWVPSRCPRCGKTVSLPPATLAMLAQSREEMEAQELSEHPVANWMRKLLAEPKQAIIGAAIILVFLFLIVDDIIAHLSNRPAAPVAVVVAPAPLPPAPRTPAPSQPPSIFVEPVAPVVPRPVAPPQPVVPPPPPPRAPFAALADVVPVDRPSEPTGAALDELIGQSITRGANWLIGQFNGDDFSATNPIGDEQMHAGVHALCTYALLQAGLAISDDRLNVQSPFMAGLLKRTKQFPMDGNKATYSRSLRVAALATADRPDDRLAIDEDAGWLTDCSMQGAFTYGKPAPGATRSSGPWDNSNSQYGALGVWAATDAGYSAPSSFWSDVVNHWEAAQTAEGGWGYQGNSGPTLTMTCAGVSILFVARDLSLADAGSTGAAPPLGDAIERGLTWLDQGDRVLGVNGGHPGYALYGLERAGLASGYKYFGQHDWYLELARRCVKDQAADGHWDGGDGARVETAFRLLFLSRGRHPILINKLRYDGHWSDRPRDALLLSAAASRRLERPLHWQVVGLDRSALEWSDCPVLYISGDQAFNVSDDQIEKLRQYVEAGGMIFTNADNNSDSFNGFAENLAHRLFGKDLHTLPADHPLYSAAFAMKNPPPLRGVDNGSRLLMVHSPLELNRYWSPRFERLDPGAVETAMNILLYAHGRREFRNRIDSLIVAAPSEAPIATMPVARLRYDGNWDPEPGAWPNFARQFQRDTGIAIAIKPIDVEKLKPTDAPLAHLTGTQAVHLSDDAAAAIKRFVQSGGVLLIDDCGSALAELANRPTFSAPQSDSATTQPFAPAIRNTLLAAIGSADALAEVYADDPILLATSAPGMADATHPRLRQFALAEYARDPNRLFVASLGRGTILYSDLDLTSGLLGTDTWGINGFSAAYSRRLVQNLVLWTMHNAAKAEPIAPSSFSPASGATGDAHSGP